MRGRTLIVRGYVCAAEVVGVDIFYTVIVFNGSDKVVSGVDIFRCFISLFFVVFKWVYCSCAIGGLFCSLSGFVVRVCNTVGNTS